MPRKKSLRLAAQHFKDHCDELIQYLHDVEANFGDEYISWSYDYGIIRLYREFEGLILECLIGAINNDTSTLSQITGYDFPPHLKDEVCRYLVVGSGYFDFKGRDDLIKILKRYIPDDHYLITIVRKPDYRETLEKLSALRNFAAHSSDVSKKAALRVIIQARVGSSGSWLKRQGRFTNMVEQLKDLADEIDTQAPY
jgi:hypothetical protein